jgi:phosphoglycerate dehydrogenase-like enzyme
VEEILRTADVVSLHLPLNAETKGFIDQKKLVLMKPTAILINVGRGKLVDEEALAAALRSHKLGYAATDVFSQEPPPQDHPLFGLDNIILTPHLAGATNESRARIVSMAMENIARVIKGEKPHWVIK